jgi:hypothetical protein
VACGDFPKLPIKVDATILKQVPEVNARPENSCVQKREIAAQKSWLESTTSGKNVVYAPDCVPRPIQPPPAPKPVASLMP